MLKSSYTLVGWFIMSKKEDFKEFVSTHPELVNVVKNKVHTWQDLFEVYDLYGNDESLWNNYLNSRESNNVSDNKNQLNSLGELTKLFKNVNIDNVQKYIETAQKAIGVIQELTGSNGISTSSSGPSVARPINKIFED